MWGVVIRIATMVTTGALFAACTSSEPPTPAERGRRVYMANCIVCHNPDPTKPGSAGPEVAGASRELVEARVIHGTYPPGHTPKRASKAMIPLPHLKNRIDDIVAFLAEAANPPSP